MLPICKGRNPLLIYKFTLILILFLGFIPLNRTLVLIYLYYWWYPLISVYRPRFVPKFKLFYTGHLLFIAIKLLHLLDFLRTTISLILKRFIRQLVIILSIV